MRRIEFKQYNRIVVVIGGIMVLCLTPAVASTSVVRSAPGDTILDAIRIDSHPDRPLPIERVRNIQERKNVHEHEIRRVLFEYVAGSDDSDDPVVVNMAERAISVIVHYSDEQVRDLLRTLIAGGGRLSAASTVNYLYAHDVTDLESEVEFLFDATGRSYLAYASLRNFHRSLIEAGNERDASHSRNIVLDVLGREMNPRKVAHMDKQMRDMDDGYELSPRRRDILRVLHQSLAAESPVYDYIVEQLSAMESSIDSDGWGGKD